MKITDFLKTYSLIDKNFIDDFYSFYDEGKNEYDYVINLDNIAKWLELRKGHLKDLLVSNFIEEQDYVILEKSKGKGRGIGSNNVKPVYLNYTCAKLLCMISRTEKASLIRNYYIDLEKLLIKYKEEIVDSLNKQLGIKENNKKVIEKNKQSGLIYVLKVDDETFKIGRTGEIKKRMKQYNVGKLYELRFYKKNNIFFIKAL
jgi:phage anti-repressor protein